VRASPPHHPSFALQVRGLVEGLSGYVPLDTLNLARLPLTPAQRWSIFVALSQPAELVEPPSSHEIAASTAPLPAGAGGGRKSATAAAGKKGSGAKGGAFAALAADSDNESDEGGGEGVGEAGAAVAGGAGGDGGGGWSVGEIARVHFNAAHEIVGVQVRGSTTDPATLLPELAAAVAAGESRGPNGPALAVAALACQYITRCMSRYPAAFHGLGQHVVPAALSAVTPRIRDAWTNVARHALLLSTALLAFPLPAFKVVDIVAGIGAERHGTTRLGGDLPAPRPAAGGASGASGVRDASDDGFEHIAGAVDRVGLMHAVTLVHWYDDVLGRLLTLMSLTLCGLDGASPLPVPEPKQIMHHRLAYACLFALGYFHGPRTGAEVAPAAADTAARRGAVEVARAVGAATGAAAPLVEAICNVLSSW